MVESGAVKGGREERGWGDALHDFVVLLQAVVDEPAFNQADEEDVEDQIQDYEG